MAILAATGLCLIAFAAFSRPDRDPPPGSAVSSPPGPAGPTGIRLLVDDTSWDPSTGQRVIRQEIFDQILAMVDRADRFLILDLFLWNPWTGKVPENHRALSGELARAVIDRKNRLPDLPIIVLTDPINHVYGGMAPEFFREMASAGIQVVFTPLERLPDSNPAWGAIWRPLEGAAARTRPSARFFSRPRLDHPFDPNGPSISLSQFGRMLLFKANHRKVVIAGSGRLGIEAIVGSLNPADGSSAHSNMALLTGGAAAKAALLSELSLIRWAAARPATVPYGSDEEVEAVVSMARSLAERMTPQDSAQGPLVSFVSEGAVASALERALETAGTGDEVRLAMFYLSDRSMVDALAGAAGRGARVRLILDANRDAFGMRKIGVPNRPVAAELLRRGSGRIEVRWADTHGEQFHTKAVSISGRQRGFFSTGSANWTRRNLRDLNLEANLTVEGGPEAVEAFNRFFDQAWDNEGGLSRTLPYESWKEKGARLWAKTALYRFQEWSGMGTF